jgi:hypothetical protein
VVDATRSNTAVFATVIALAAAVVAANSRGALLLGRGRAKVAALAAIAGAATSTALLAAWRVSDSDDPAAPGTCTAIGVTVAFLLSSTRVWSRDRRSGERAPFAARLVRHMAAQAVWVLPGLMVGAVDNFLVAEFDETALANYSIGLAFVTLGVGFVSAVAAPMIRALVVDDAIVQRTLIPWARLVTAASIAIVPLGLVGLASVAAVQSRNVTSEEFAAVTMMAAGQSMRTLTSPLASLAIVTDRQAALFPGSIAEGVTNLALSAWLGSALGVIGVGLGTVAGALALLAAHGWARHRSFYDGVVTRRVWRTYTVAPAAAVLAFAVVFLVVA